MGISGAPSAPISSAIISKGSAGGHQRVEHDTLCANIRTARRTPYMCHASRCMMTAIAPPPACSRITKRPAVSDGSQAHVGSGGAKHTKVGRPPNIQPCWVRLLRRHRQAQPRPLRYGMDCSMKGCHISENGYDDNVYEARGGACV